MGFEEIGLALESGSTRFAATAPRVATHGEGGGRGAGVCEARRMLLRGFKNLGLDLESGSHGICGARSSSGNPRGAGRQRGTGSGEAEGWGVSILFALP